MTVQELIDELMKVEDKDKEVTIDSYYLDFVYKNIEKIKEYKDEVTIYMDL